jgi:predicted HNH restriction endonuclease
MTYSLGDIPNNRRFGIFARYGYYCECCGNYSKGLLCLHHIQPVKCGGDDSDDNLIPVCFNCHDFIHSGEYRGPLLKLRRRR